ncbi:MAG: Mut7-C ubiquitin/RNAse domain-containing protein [Bacteroidales bacterium]|nr:Mut7-C ubiquitin/RNAse domain-containing protein [Bacteroidales bacterium]
MPVFVDIRVYEELNDFLKKDNQKKIFNAAFPVNTSVKDAVESLGIPHTEVDMILVNSIPVPFSYRLKNMDYISVYPVFESFDISGVTKVRAAPLRSYKFIFDVHLGKLSRYMRLLGFDSLYENNFSDPEIIEKAQKEQRIILTCDIELLKNSRVTHGYFVRNRKPKQQLEELFSRFELKSLCRPFTRCSICNTILIQKTKKDVVSYLNLKTKKYYSEFYYCPSCLKVYWKGSHFQNLERFFRTLDV